MIKKINQKSKKYKYTIALLALISYNKQVTANNGERYYETFENI